MRIEKRYKALRFVADVFETLGVFLAGITCVVVAIIVTSTFDRGFKLELYGGVIVPGLAIALITLLQGGLLSLALYAVGAFIDLMIDLGENTDLAVRLLRQQVDRSHPNAQSNREISDGDADSLT